MDLLKIGRSLAEMIAQRPDFNLVPLSANDIDIVVIFCGCPRACGSKEEVRGRGRHYLLINDESLSDISVLGSNLFTALKE